MRSLIFCFCILAITVNAKLDRKIVSRFKCSEKSTSRVTVQLGDITCDSTNTPEMGNRRSLDEPADCVSVSQYGSYNVSVTENDVTKIINVEYMKLLKLPMYKLSESFVKHLLTTKYIYLNMVHRFQSSNYYLPRLSKLFRGLMDQTTELLDKVSNYILAKQITTTFLDGVSSPDYVCAFLKEGFPKRLDVTQYCKTNITCLRTSFKSVIKREEETVKELTNIIYLAHSLDDHEMVEFLSVEILPLITKTMKAFTDHKNTLKSMAHGDNKALGEFLFDKMLE